MGKSIVECLLCPAMRRVLPLVLVTLACSHAAVREVERFDKPDEAAAYDAMRHAAAPGIDPQERYATARAQMALMPHYSTVDNVAPTPTARATTDAGTAGRPWRSGERR